VNYSFPVPESSPGAQGQVWHILNPNTGNISATIGAREPAINRFTLLLRIIVAAAEKILAVSATANKKANTSCHNWCLLAG
jgi:hypothetical protein